MNLDEQGKGLTIPGTNRFRVSVYSKAWNIRSGHGQIYKY